MSSAEPALTIHPPGASADVVLLAELADDLADSRTVPATHLAHLAGCAECRAVVDALTSVRADLRAEIRPMPAAVSRRIAASLVEAAGSGSTAGSGSRTDTGSASGPTASVVPLSGRHRAASRDDYGRARRLRVLRAVGAAAAGLVIVGGGGYLLVDGVGSVTGSSESADGGGGDAGAATVDDSSGIPAYDRESLEADVDALLDNDESVDGAGGAPAEPNVPESAVTGVDDDCLASLPVATGAALSISRATYEGQPAIIVLFASSGGMVQVTVVSDCTAGEPRVLDQFETTR